MLSAKHSAIIKVENEKKFYLDPSFIKSYSSIMAPFGFNGLGEAVYKRTYSRLKLNDDGSDNGNEEWKDTVERVVNGTYRMMHKTASVNNHAPWCVEKAQNSAQEMFDRIFNMKFLPPGRGLWAMGTKITEDLKLYASLNNCGFVSTKRFKQHDLTDDERVEPFIFLMSMSMKGVGVGFDTLGGGIDSFIIPGIQKDKNYKSHEGLMIVVQDTREGWVSSTEILLRSYLCENSNNVDIYFDYTKIRDKGKPLKTFGGIAPGPEPLIKLHKQLEKILIEHVGNPMSITLIADIQNLIGACVVAGGVRRTAEIAFGKYGDEEFLSLKDPRSSRMNFENGGWGWVSNNSVIIDPDDKDILYYLPITMRMVENGEPGIFWLKNAQNYGRMTGREYDNRKEPKVCGSNPCVTDDTIVLTKEYGPMNVRGLIGKQFTALVNGKEYSSGKNGFWHVGTKPTYEILLDDGTVVKATEEHKFLCSDDSWNKVKDFKQNCTHLKLNQHINYKWTGGRGSFEEGYFCGWLIGDGTFVKDNPVISMWIPKSVENIEDYEPAMILQTWAIRFLKHRKDFKGFNLARSGAKYNEYRMNCSNFREISSKYEIYPNDKDVPTINISYDFARGLIMGLFDSDGCPQGHHNKDSSIRLSQSNIKRLYNTQRILLSLGIHSKIYKNIKKSGFRLLPNGRGESSEYMCKTTHELIISRVNIRTYYDIIGFYEPQKKSKLENIISSHKRPIYKDSFTSKVVSVKLLEKPLDVYDCSIDDIHAFDANGTIAHNCVEQSLESFELCNLVETFPANHENIEDYMKTLKYAYLYAKVVTTGTTSCEKTNEIIARNRRIGCSMTGVAQFVDKWGRKKLSENIADNTIEWSKTNEKTLKDMIKIEGMKVLKQWCNEGYKRIRQWDATYSFWLGIPESIKVTSIKPSGTVSTLSGASCGMHWPIERYYKRRVRFNECSPMLKDLENAGYPIEKDIYADNTMVVTFPVFNGSESIPLESEVSVEDQFEMTAFLQEHWADNQVSVTIKFMKEATHEEIGKYFPLLATIKSMDEIKNDLLGGNWKKYITSETLQKSFEILSEGEQLESKCGEIICKDFYYNNPSASTKKCDNFEKSLKHMISKVKHLIKSVHLADLLVKYQTKLKAVSMLPINENGYAQAPFEAITKEAYEDMLKSISTINKWSQMPQPETPKGCDGDSCTLGISGS